MNSRLFLRLPNWLGDIVMSLPALAAVRARWPDARLTVGIPGRFASLMAVVEGVDDVIELSGSGGGRGASFERDVEAIRGGSLDTAILFTNSFASARMVARARVPERWGYRSDFRSSLLTRDVAKPARRAGAERHQSRYYAHLVESLGCPVPSYDVRLSVPDAWRAAGRELLARRGVSDDAKVIGFAPGAAYGTAKQWPPDRVAHVVERCAERGATCVLAGSPGDRPAGEEIDRALGSTPHRASIVNVIGDTDLPALAGLLSHCAAFVCNDSGAMHLASATGVPVVATFGSTDEWATSPMGPHALIAGSAWCRPCLRRECPIDHRCMTSISSQEVFDAVSRHLPR